MSVSEFREILDRYTENRQDTFMNKTLNKFWKRKEKLQNNEKDSQLNEIGTEQKQRMLTHKSILQKFRNQREEKQQKEQSQKSVHRKIKSRMVNQSSKLHHYALSFL